MNVKSVFIKIQKACSYDRKSCYDLFVVWLNSCCHLYLRENASNLLLWYLLVDAFAAKTIWSHSYDTLLAV